MVYYCIRCGYGTNHKNYMKVHFNREKLCKMDIFIFLTKEEQYELSILPYKEEKYDRENIIKILMMGPTSMSDYFHYKERENKIESYVKEEEEKKEKKKKVHKCTKCSNTFYDKSGLNRHTLYNRCKMLKLDDKYKETEKDEEMIEYEDIMENEDMVNTYQVRFDTSHMMDKETITEMSKTGKCYETMVEWFYENPRNWNVYMENDKIDWVIIYDQSSLFDKKLRLMDFEVFLVELLKKIHINIHLFMEQLKKTIPMKTILEIYNKLKIEQDELENDIIKKNEFIQKIKMKIIENRDYVMKIFRRSIQNYQIYYF